MRSSMNRRSLIMDNAGNGEEMEKILRRKSKLLGANRRSQPSAMDCDGLTSVHQASLMGNVNLLRKLIQCGANVNVQDNKGMTPLHYAAWQSSPEIASLLLQNGATANARNQDGSTPLHVACHYGQNDLVSLFLYYGADPFTRNWKNAASPFDCACEYGRCKAVELILDYAQRKQQAENFGARDQCLSDLLLPSAEETGDNNVGEGTHSARSIQKLPCSPLNLAARNGHVDVLRILLDVAAFDVNKADAGSGGNTALHDAAVHMRYEMVQFLTQAGADPKSVNDSNHTPLDLVRKLKPKCEPLAQKVKLLLEEASAAIYAKAVRDFTAGNEQELTFSFGDIIWVLEKTDGSRWQGSVVGPKYGSRIGYFPADAVQLIDKKIGMQRSASQRQVKKVNVPLVPDIPGMQHNSSSTLQPAINGQQCHSSMTNQMVPLLNNGNNNFAANCGSLSRRSVAFGTLAPATNQQNDHHSASLRSQSSTVTNTNHPLLMTGSSQVNGNSVLQSPARHRNSTGSNSSQTSSGFESMKSGMGQPYVNVTVHQLRGDSPPSRNSVHSSGSSSLGSLERLDESGYGSTGHINVAEMVSNGVPDEEILSAWLHHLHYEEYLPLFVNAGYDLPTVARMTPEDLTAIGITKPGHRKRLTTEIHKLSLPDQWPAKKPASLREWLCALNLPEYVPLFESQGFTNFDQLAQLTWEDYEDLGVKKLGHLKKLVLASKKLKGQRQQSKTGTATASLDMGAGTGELLVINVPPPSVGLMGASQGGIRTAEVRPYSHLPAEVMSTFHHSQQQVSPRHGCNTAMYQPELVAISSQKSSPNHRAYTQYQYSSSIDQHHCFQNQNVAVVMTEAVVHDRPKVTVKPILSVSGTAKRGSREGLDVVEEYKRCGSPLMQSPRHRQFQQIDTSNCFAMGGSAGDVSNDYRYRPNRPTSTALLSGDIMCRSAPQPADQCRQAPQKPPIGPLARPGAVFQLSINPLPKLMQGIDEGSSFDELSPAPSMDEFPPPPSPILCMESIKNLRNVREHNPHLATVSMSADDESMDLDLKLANSATGTMARRMPNGQGGGDGQEGAGLANRRATTSTTSIESNSSTETLPFANENVGTIRQRNNNQVNSPDCHSTPGRKPHVNEVFVNGLSPRRAGSSNSNANTSKPGNVLNDIGSMLQDLTDQLDALLKEPKQQQQQ